MKVDDKRIFVGVGVSLVLLVLVLCWFISNCFDYVEQFVEEQQTASTAAEPNDSTMPRQAKQKQVGRQSVKGMEKAAGKQVLHDPFTLAHETEAEAAQIAQPKPQTPPAPEKASPSVPPKQAPPTPQAESYEPPAPSLALQGIAGGEQGRLAILSDGRQSMALAVGESLGAWQVQDIEANRVLVAGPDGEKWLPLSMP